MYVFTFPAVSNACSLITIFYVAVLKSDFWRFQFYQLQQINMKKNNVKYLQNINFSQLTLTVKNEIKNLRSAILNLVISQSLSTRKQTDVKKSNPALNVKHKWLSGCAKWITLLSPSDESYNHSDAVLPYESPTSRHCTLLTSLFAEWRSNQ